MARENKRKRDEKRFGRAQRLADRIITTPVSEWSLIHPKMAPTAEMFQGMVRDAKVIRADNVGEFYYTTPKNRFDYQSDFPTPIPSFPLMFIEMRRPSHIVCEDRIYEWPNYYPSEYGCLVKTGVIGDDANCTFPVHILPGSGAFLEEARKAGEPRFIVLQIGFVAFGDGPPRFECSGQWLALDREGSVLCQPFPMMPGRILSDDRCEILSRQYFPFLQSVTLTQSFMNCTNVIMESCEPDSKLNRERRRHGLRPFVRYHTINIEPMKKVLRIEGNIEAEGLKRALHICRGHFSRYTQEKPLFGKHVGTFWIPSHVRGSSKNGIVVSDYNVNAPKGDAAQEESAT